MNFKRNLRRLFGGAIVLLGVSPIASFSSNPNVPIPGGRPHLSIVLPSGTLEAVMPGDAVTVKGVGLHAGTSVEVLLDGRAVAACIADSNGEIVLQISAPNEFGLHTLVLRDAHTGDVIDGSNFLVRHNDARGGA